MVRLVLLCFVYSLPGPPKATFDTGTYQLYPVNKRLCPEFDPKRDATFDLYTKANNNTSQVLQIGNDSSLVNSYINFRIPTILFFHGYLESSHSEDGIKIKDNYLKIGEYNVILVNIERLLAGPFYVTSALNVKPIGKYTAGFVDYLVKKGLDLNNLHIIGMSLGAHIAGYVGKNLESGRPPRITGLDPAGPLLDFVPQNERLSIGDADFVDVIHTNAGIFGTRFSVGDVNIWFNGGTFQPGCDPITALKRVPGSIAEVVFCNHYQAWRIYVKTIINPKEYLATKCKNHHDYRKGKCIRNETTYAGMNVSKTARGDYYVDTGVTAVNV
ncbi:lipase member H-like [Anoplophora glabripennis]|uniref:lipase member H-like n=1 Tax=Anoplophora glabripennis TaxID=217634 RepID=UPI000875A13F|nr:lipase member H-like [Anoplophora glabripennis]